MCKIASVLVKYFKSRFNIVKLLLTGDDSFGVGIRLEFQMFTPTCFQNSICIGQIEVSDGQVHPFECSH